MISRSKKRWQRGRLAATLMVIALMLVGVTPSYAGVTAATQLVAPTSVMASDAGPTTIGLQWQSVSGTGRHRIQLSTSPALANSTYQDVTGSRGDLRALKPDTTYYFRVRMIDSGGTGISPYSNVATVRTDPTPNYGPVLNPLSVASYNVSCDYCFEGRTNELPWNGRKAAVVSTILSKSPDVLGVQEASSGRLRDASWPDGLSQFEDLLQQLRGAGKAYQLTNNKKNNCVNDSTPTNCAYKYTGASSGTKILYNADKVSLVREGSVKLDSIPGSDDRYMAWAILNQKSTNKKFFFVDTHLSANSSPAYQELRKAQTQRIVNVIRDNNQEGLPTLVVGDLNSHKWTVPSNAPYDVLTGAGYIDPLGNTYQNDYPSSAATVETRINANYTTYNGFARQAPARRSDGNGTCTDYIFTSKMRVPEWETVVDIDTAGNFNGVIPSDHNMVSATVMLP